MRAIVFIAIILSHVLSVWFVYDLLFGVNDAYLQRTSSISSNNTGAISIEVEICKTFRDEQGCLAHLSTRLK